MERVFQIIRELQSTSSRNQKETILAKNKDCSDFTTIMKFVFSPYVSTGIGLKKLDKALDTAEHVDEVINGWEYVAARFSNTTGNDTDLEVACNLVLNSPEHYRDIMKDIITNSLKIGVTVKTLNKVYGEDFLPVIGCMLGTSIKDVKEDKKKGTWIITEKFDGQRNYIVKDHDGTVSIYCGRKGMPDNDYPDIQEQAKELPEGYVYDGEMLADGEYENNIEHRQATRAICSKKGPKTGVSLHVFDFIPIDHFKKGISTVPCRVRKGAVTQILDILKLPNIVNVPMLGMVEDCDADKIAEIVEPLWAAGKEGIMLNRETAPYEIKRSTNLLKVKFTETYDLRIIDVEEGSKGTKNEGRLGAFVVSYKGNRVSVGSGIDDIMRIEAWNNPTDYIGYICEVATFGESTNQKGGTSLNSPIFNGMRYDKDEADY